MIETLANLTLSSRFTTRKIAKATTTISIATYKHDLKIQRNTLELKIGLSAQQIVLGLLLIEKARTTED